MTRTPPELHIHLREPRHPRRGDQALRTVVLGHALGADHTMWDALADTLAEDLRVIAWDQRGHGRSGVPDGPSRIEDLADDAARVIDAHAPGERVLYIGLSLGGMVGQALALRRPALLRGLVLANTSAGYPPAAQAVWDERIAALEATDGDGVPVALADGTAQRWFTPDFQARSPEVVERFRQGALATSRQGYLSCCHAIRHLDLLGQLNRITVPALVIAGANDVGTPVAMNRAIADALPGARLLVLPEAAHQSVIEQPLAFAAAVQGFIAGLAAARSPG